MTTDHLSIDSHLSDAPLLSPEMHRLPSPQAIEREVARILREACGVQQPISEETRLAEDLGLDSVGLLTLALEVENRYRFALGEDPDHPPRTVGDLVELVWLRLSEGIVLAL